MAFNRRQILIGTSIVGANLAVTASKAQIISVSPTPADLDLESGRLAGTVNLVFSGERPSPRTHREVLAFAESQEFHSEGMYVEEYLNGRAEYIPTVLSENSLLEAVMRGRLIYKLNIFGEPPAELRGLPEGTYYSHVDYAPGHYREGGWVSRLVNGSGQMLGLATGVQVKKVVTFFTGEPHDHSQPIIFTHGLGTGVIDDPSTDKWKVTWGDWEPYGDGGCMRTFYCEPTPVVSLP